MTVVLAHAPSPAAESAFAVAVRQARAWESPLIIANVVPTDALAASSAVAPEALDELVRRASEAGVAASSRTLLGDDVVALIDDLVRAADADVLVIGSRRRSPVGKLLLGSVAQRLILEVSCPVLVVKPEEAADGR